MRYLTEVRLSFLRCDALRGSNLRNKPEKRNWKTDQNSLTFIKIYYQGNVVVVCGEYDALSIFWRQASEMRERDLYGKVEQGRRASL